MFDNNEKKDIQKEQGVSGQPSPSSTAAPEMKTNEKKVEDIYAETEKEDAGTDSAGSLQASSAEEKIEKPAVFQPKTESERSMDKAEESAVGGKKSKKIFFFLGIIIAVGVFAAAGWFGYSYYFKGAEGLGDNGAGVIIDKNTGQNLSPNSDQNAKQPEPAVSSPSPAQPVPPASAPATVIPSLSEDSDQDGLSDEEEKALGTDINSIDSDNDGLFDREEVKVYKTDPMNPDTDGDGYLDGEEVKQGYNPKGTGTLYKITP